MVRIPRSEQGVGLSGQAMPASTGDGYEAPGKALQKFGEGFTSFALAFNKQQDDLADFEGRNNYQTFVNEVDKRRREADTNLTGDGRGHTDRMDADTDTAFQRFATENQHLPARTQRTLQLQYGRDRNRFSTRSFVAEQNRIGPYFEEQGNVWFNNNVVPRLFETDPETGQPLTDRLTSVGRASAEIDRFIDGAPGMPPAVRERLRAEMAKKVYQLWQNNAGPDAAVERDRIVEGLRLELDGVTPQDMYGEDARPAGRRGRRSDATNGPTGNLSARYESGGRGVGFISSGKDDPGGQSYGIHQLSSAHSMRAFLRSPEGQPYASEFGRSNPATPTFNRIYREIADRDPEGFAEAQRKFYTRTHYEPTRGVAERAGFDTSNPAVQEALFSISVQHGRAAEVVERAAASLGQNATPEQQIRALYRARTAYVAGLSTLPENTRASVLNRYRNEERDALAMLGGEPGRRDGPVRVAQAGNIRSDATEVAQAQPRTEDLVRRYIVDNQVEIERFAEQRRRRLEIDERQEETKLRRDTANEGFRRLEHLQARRAQDALTPGVVSEPDPNKPELTREWIEEQRALGLLDPTPANRLMRGLDPMLGRARISNSDVYRRLMQESRDASSLPQVVADRALDMFHRDMLTRRDYDAIVANVRNRAQGRRIETPPFVTDAFRELDRNVTLPTRASSEAERQRYNDTLGKLNDYVRRGLEAGNLDPKALSEYVSGLADTNRRDATRSIMDQVRKLPRSRYLTVDPSSATLEHVGEASAKLRADVEAGRISGQDMNNEINLLKLLNQALTMDHQRANRGQSPPPPRASAPSSPGSQPQNGQRGNQSPQEPPSPFDMYGPPRINEPSAPTQGVIKGTPNFRRPSVAE